jgi:mRNA-degrading endonuclease RelE of RelBE toxin-antitoxin system
MKTKVHVGRQVEDFLKALAPQPRRALRQAMKNLADNQGDVKLLEGNLSGLLRLRVGKFRVIFAVRTIRGERVCLCFYVNYRSIVYAILEQLLASGLIEELKQN